LELIKDYDLGINYHPGKANVVVDALSQRSHVSQLVVLWYKGMICVANVKELKDKILHETHELLITFISEGIRYIMISRPLIGGTV
jgi:hypothetical protein